MVSHLRHAEQIKHKQDLAAKHCKTTDTRDNSPAFQRRVRVYDPSGKLSRHMNPEIDEIVLKFETSLGLPPVMSVSLQAQRSPSQRPPSGDMPHVSMREMTSCTWRA